MGIISGVGLLLAGTAWKDDSLSLVGLGLITSFTGVKFAKARR